MHRRRFLATASSGLLGLAIRPAIAVSPGTGNFAIAQDGDTFWFSDPAGALTVSLGINHVEPSLLLQPYNRSATLARYGPDFARFGTFDARGEGARRWAAQVYTDLADWNFNTLGFHTGIPRALLDPRVAFCPVLNAGGVSPEARPGELVDVYASDVAATIDRETQAACATLRTAPNLLGYYFTDRPRFGVRPGGPQNRVHPWVNALCALPSTAPGKAAWLTVLKGRHSSAGDAAATHGILEDVATWDGLARIRAWPLDADSPSAALDRELFLAQTVDRWYALRADAIRRYDPDHLILGDKLGGGTAAPGYREPRHPNLPDWLMPILARHVDVVSVEWYGEFEDQVAALRAIHLATGKPILLGDSSFSQVQPQQLGDAKGVHEPSQAAVGAAYARYLRAALGEGYIVGWHFCGYMESWWGGGRGKPQNGLKDPFDVPHADAVDAIRVANAAACDWHARPTPTQAASP